MNKGRLEAFSDGVFAIVITLLILNVKLPDADYTHLGNALVSILPTLGIYIISFLLVGMYWVFHHYAFTFIAQVDGVLLWLNVFFLLFISFVPFPAMMMGKYPFHTIPIIVYSCNLILSNAMGFLSLIYLWRNKNLATPIFTREVFRLQLQLYLVVNVIYIIAIMVSFIAPAISFITLGTMTVLLIFRSIRMSGVGKCEQP